MENRKIVPLPEGKRNHPFLREINNPSTLDAMNKDNNQYGSGDGNEPPDGERLARLEVKVDHIEKTLTNIEKRFDKIDNKFDKVDEKFDKIDNKFDKISDKIDSNFKWTIGILIVTILVPIALHFIPTHF